MRRMSLQRGAFDTKNFLAKVKWNSAVIPLSMSLSSSCRNFSK